MYQILLLYIKKIISCILLILLFSEASADHMNGGQVMYEYVGAGDFNSKIYKITLVLYKDANCSGCPDMPNWVRMRTFKNLDRSQFSSTFVQQTSIETIPAGEAPPCITEIPTLSYLRVKYSYTIELPNSYWGYTISFQHCCRPELANVVAQGYPGSFYNNLTYTGVIPGVNSRTPLDLNDTSPFFNIKMTPVCANRQFRLSFNAVDANGDHIEYYFGDAYLGHADDTFDYIFPPNVAPPQPPYKTLEYVPGFSAASPMGPNVTIDRFTGEISGLAPDAGKYLVSLIVYTMREPRGGFDVTTFHRLDFVVTVSNCDVPGIFLNPDGYTNCKDSTITFDNLNNSALNTTYDWDFGDPLSGASNTSTQVSPTHTFSGPGTYIVKLTVNKGTACADSAKTFARVYPGFYPGFTATSPQCVNANVLFTDTTKTDHGIVNYWNWEFGANGANGTSSTGNTSFRYQEPGLYRVFMNVATDKGCKASVLKEVLIVDKPKLTTTNDTLICSIDALQLKVDTIGAAIAGSVTWSPNYMINDIYSLTPVVSPDVTTTYYVQFSANAGTCTVTDSIKVNVVDFVTLHVPNDTTICTTDQMRLAVESDALHYAWTPAAGLSDPFIKNPVAKPLHSTVYNLVATIGGCTATADISIKTVDYPKANAGPDQSVCLGASAYLHASGGAYYFWSPAAFLTATNIPDPVSVNPTSGVKYVVTVRDTLGCPKTVKDTMIMRVISIKADAGPADTVAVLGQPMQLHASGAVSYSWQPTTWLSDANSANPVALPQRDIVYVLTATDASGCYGTDSIHIKLYNLSPGLYTPNAFTPNGDGLNDYFKPVGLGMKSLSLFHVYNRGGQRVFSGTNSTLGWDGKFKGMPQGSGTYVWYAEGIDYLGNKVQKKGYVVLIR